ncbi:MAG: hypothetical protein K0R51_844 [Cytophagaceae bacterium]|jgi:hypothetical protein|nr:hypothetical protein [Cytophagaceae bacterium]
MFALGIEYNRARECEDCERSSARSGRACVAGGLGAIARPAGNALINIRQIYFSKFFIMA